MAAVLYKRARESRVRVLGRELGKRYRSNLLFPDRADTFPQPFPLLDALGDARVATRGFLAFAIAESASTRGQISKTRSRNVRSCENWIINAGARSEWKRDRETWRFYSRNVAFPPINSVSEIVLAIDCKRALSVSR